MSYILYGIGFQSDKNYYIRFNNLCYVGDLMTLNSVKVIDELVNSKLSIKNDFPIKTKQTEMVGELTDIDTFTKWLANRYETSFSQHLCKSFINYGDINISEFEIPENKSIDDEDEEDNENEYM